MSRLAKNIEFWIEKRGLSQAALSAKAGLASSAVNDILKTPDRSPRLATIEALATALEIPVWQLIEGGNAAVDADEPGGNGITILDQGDLSGAERSLLAVACGHVPFSVKTSALGIVDGDDLRPFGFSRGDYVIILPELQASGEFVAVEIRNQDQSHTTTIRYCAPPWLIRVSIVGDFEHNYMEAPGYRVLGVCRKALSGRLDFAPVESGGPGGRSPRAIKDIR